MISWTAETSQTAVVGRRGRGAARLEVAAAVAALPLLIPAYYLPTFSTCSTVPPPGPVAASRPGVTHT